MSLCPLGNYHRLISCSLQVFPRNLRDLHPRSTIRQSEKALKLVDYTFPSRNALVNPSSLYQQYIPKRYDPLTSDSDCSLVS